MRVEDKKGKLDRLVEDWLGSMTCLDASKGTYVRVLKSWNRWMILNKHYNAMGATRNDVNDYRSWMISSGKSSHTICNYLCILRMFYRYLYQRGEKPDIISGIRGVKRQKYFNKRPLTNTQVEDLFGCIDVSTEIGMRDRLILMLMVGAGLRCCEVARLDSDDIITISGTASLRLQRKGHLSKDLYIPISDAVRDALSDYLALRHPAKGEPMIITYNRRLRDKKRIRVADVEMVAAQRMAAAGIRGDGLSAHSLRHTFGCMLVDEGTPMNEVQMLMGHNSIDATMIYVKMAAERELYAKNPANRIKIPRKAS